MAIMCRARLSSFLLAGLVLVTGAVSGCGGQEEVACEEAEVRVCAFNPETRAYDRDCRWTCPASACPRGTVLHRQCLWSQGPGCESYCRAPTDAGAPVRCGDGGPPETNYFSSDPRCQ